MEKIMREKFLEIPNIGQTYLIDILLFFYVPKVFVIENDNHETFLLYEWTDDYSWFATQINKKEYEKLLIPIIKDNPQFALLEPNVVYPLDIGPLLREYNDKNLSI